MRIPNHLLGILTLSALLVPPSLAEQARPARPIVLSERVGETLDRAENQRWKIYENLGFISARYYQLHDSTYVAEITLEEAGQPVAHWVQVSPVMLRVLGDYISDNEQILARRAEETRRERRLFFVEHFLFAGGAILFGWLTLDSAHHSQ